MSRRMGIRIAVMVALAAVVVAIYLSPLRDHLTRDNVRAFVEHLRGLWYGPLVFIATFTLACVFALPASVFVLAAGFIFGWLPGLLYSFAGGMLGATASYYIGRFVGEGLLEKFGRVGRAVAKQVDHATFGSLLALRFIPGIPFPVLNYGCGVTAVRVRDYLASTAIGVIPPMFVFTWCADALFNGSMSEGAAVRTVVTVLLLMLSLTLLPRVVKRFARRAEAAE